MNKTITSKICTAFIVLALAATLSQGYFQFSAPFAHAASTVTLASDLPQPALNVTGSNESFSIVWITDTQYLSESYPRYFDSLCRWIVNNAAAYNAKMVVHSGDLVDSEGNLTQWANANSSISILLDAGIPYCWNAGNHDYNATCWLGNQFVAFNASFLAEKPYWISQETSGQNTAVHFNASGQDWLIVNVEYNANDSVLTWANNILDTYPNSHAVVAAHFYVNRTGGYESWATNFQNKVLNTHPNVFLTLSAHVYPLANSGLRIQIGDRNELVFNRQDKDSEMGAASLRILTFNTEKGTIDVKTFVLYANQFLSDSNNQFTLNTTFRNDAAQNKNVPEFPATIVTPILVVFAASILICIRNCKKWFRT